MVKNILSFLFLCIIRINFAQSNVNPDISLIGTFNTNMSFIKTVPEYGKLNFETPAMELFFDGYLNPFARATANIAYEDEEFSVEELYASILSGLPLDMQLKAGKSLVGFGKINTVHPHAWAFLERPLFHQVFFGKEGFNDVGISLNYLLPTGDIYSSIELGIYNGQSFEPLIDSTAIDRKINPIFSGRINSFFDLNDYTNLEIGLSSSYGCYSKSLFIFTEDYNTSAQIKPMNFLYGGFDFKLKYSPDSYTAFIIQGEALLNTRDVKREAGSGTNLTRDELNKITNFGAFIYADYKFIRQFSLGLKYDYTSGIIDDESSFISLANDDKNSTQGIEGWVSYHPVEETIAIKLGFQHLIFNLNDGIPRDGETKVKLQLLFSLGPHKAHQF